MRNFLTISVISIFVVFVLIVIPASLTGAKDINKEEGRVLGVSEERGEEVDEYMKEFFNNYNSLPESNNVESAVLERTKEPFRRDDCQSVDIGGMYGVVVDMASDKVLFDEKSDIKVPIASITKLMTALTFLDYDIPPNSFLEISRGDLISGAQIHINTGENIEINDLFNLSLIASANSATKALVRSTGLSEAEFVQKMNEKAKELGLLNTHFVDPIGFAYNNLSTAKDVSIILKNALKNEAIAKTVKRKKYSFKTKEGRLVSVTSTNKLFGSFSGEDIEILGGKTGYTSSAGYCFAGGFIDEAGNQLLSVVLGGESYNSRFFYTDKIVKWAFNNYDWR